MLVKDLQHCHADLLVYFKQFQTARSQRSDRVRSSYFDMFHVWESIFNFSDPKIVGGRFYLRNSEKFMRNSEKHQTHKCHNRLMFLSDIVCLGTIFEPLYSPRTIGLQFYEKFLRNSEKSWPLPQPEWFKNIVFRLQTAIRIDRISDWVTKILPWSDGLP